MAAAEKNNYYIGNKVLLQDRDYNVKGSIGTADKWKTETAFLDTDETLNVLNETC